jgi:23S rRNA pseudouridine2605 synthase
MELEEKKNEELTKEQQNTAGHESGYQGYRPGRSPRPRIHQPRPYTTQGGYNRNQNQDEGGFRPEGFGAGLQSAAPQHGGYRPRNNYNNEGGYQPRPRQQYGQQQG